MSLIFPYLITIDLDAAFNYKNNYLTASKPSNDNLDIVCTISISLNSHSEKETKLVANYLAIFNTNYLSSNLKNKSLNKIEESTDGSTEIK